MGHHHVRTRRRNPPPRLHPLQSQCPLPRSLFPKQPGPRVPLKTHLPPYPHQHTTPSLIRTPCRSMTCRMLKINGSKRPWAIGLHMMQQVISQVSWSGAAPQLRKPQQRGVTQRLPAGLEHCYEITAWVESVSEAPRHRATPDLINEESVDEEAKSKEACPQEREWGQCQNW